MLRTVQFACNLPRQEADALNRESGRVYSNMLVWHYRLYRHTGVWLSEYSGKRLEDHMGGSTTLPIRARKPCVFRPGMNGPSRLTSSVSL